MITTSETLPGFEVFSTLGIVEGVSEDSFPAAGVGGIGMEKGGEMDPLIYEAKEKLIVIAGKMGADAIIGFRYLIYGRHLEMGAVAYGTAGKCRKIDK